MCIGTDIAESIRPNGKPGGTIRIEDHLIKVVGVLRKFQKKVTKSSVVSIRNYNEMIFVPLKIEGAFRQVSFIQGAFDNRELTELVVQTHKTEQVLKTADLIKRILEVTHGGVKDYQMVIPSVAPGTVQKYPADIQHCFR